MNALRSSTSKEIILDDFKRYTWLEGYYQLNSQGIMRSLTRTITTKDNKKRTFLGQIVKTHPDGKGYQIAFAWRNRSRKTIRIAKELEKLFPKAQ